MNGVVESINRQTVLDKLSAVRRQELSEDLGQMFVEGYDLAMGQAVNVINAAPVLKYPFDSKVGKWKKITAYVCSSCRNVINLATEYCPNCGAKMETSE